MRYCRSKEKRFEALIYDKINKWIDFKNKKVLDIGCGTGWLGFKVSPLSKEVIGIDFSSGMIEVANRKLKKNIYGNLEFEVMDARRLKFKNQSFHVACAIGVYGYVKDIDPFVEETARVLKDGGLFFFTLHNKKYLFSRLDELLKILKLSKKSGSFLRDISETEFLLRKQGFIIKESATTYFVMPQLIWSVNKLLRFRYLKDKWISFVIKIERFMGNSVLTRNKGRLLLILALKPKKTLS